MPEFGPGNLGGTNHQADKRDQNNDAEVKKGKTKRQAEAGQSIKAPLSHRQVRLRQSVNRAWLTGSKVSVGVAGSGRGSRHCRNGFSALFSSRRRLRQW